MNEYNSIHGYTIIGEWSKGPRKHVVRATKGNNLYYIEKHTHCSSPQYIGCLDEKTARLREKEFELYVNPRLQLVMELNTLKSPIDSIIFPSDAFVFDGYYYEVVELLDCIIPNTEKEEVLRRITESEIRTIMLVLASSLATAHSAGIVFCDIEDKIVFVRNKTGLIIPKLLASEGIYFGTNKDSYLDANIICFDGNCSYYSPELAEYIYCDDAEKQFKLNKKISTKTDIFSLGLIYHFYLAGELPEADFLTEKHQKRKDKGKAIYPWDILNSGCKLQISPNIKNPTYISLISDMLSLNPADRPTASDVSKRLFSNSVNA